MLDFCGIVQGSFHITVGVAALKGMAVASLNAMEAQLLCISITISFSWASSFASRFCLSCSSLAAALSRCFFSFFRSLAATASMIATMMVAAARDNILLHDPIPAFLTQG